MWAVGITFTVFLFFVILATVILFPFDKKRTRAHAHCYWWSSAIIRLNPFWTVKVSGLENIDHTKTYVIVANHQSLADIIIMYQTKMQFKWVAKESLFSLPVLGWCLRLCRHIHIARGELSSIKNVYRSARKWLVAGTSVLFFPEGTRSETGEMKEFQNGAFKLAIREKVPVLPILLEGTFNAISKGSWLFAPKVLVRIKVLPAIDTASLKTSDFARLRDTARSMLESA